MILTSIILLWDEVTLFERFHTFLEIHFVYIHVRAALETHCTYVRTMAAPIVMESGHTSD